VKVGSSFVCVYVCVCVRAVNWKEIKKEDCDLFQSTMPVHISRDWQKPRI